MIKVEIVLAIILSCFFSNAIVMRLPDSTFRLPQFRNTSWNTSLEIVRGKESAYYLQKFIEFRIVTLSYKDRIDGIEARIDYTFKNDKLTKVSYIITQIDSY